MKRDKLMFTLRLIRAVMADGAPLLSPRVLVFTLLLASTSLRAQLSVFEYSVDARHVAMGFAGSDANATYGHFSNPAFGFSKDAVHASFSARPVDWVPIPDFDGYRGSFALSFPFRSYLGVEVFYDYDIIHLNNYTPDPVDQTILERLFGISLKHELIEDRLVAGLSIKQYLLSATVEQSATVIDLGVMLRQPLIESHQISSLITAGVSLHNFGTEIREEGQNVFQPPRFFRASLGWSSTFGLVDDWTRISLDVALSYWDQINQRYAPDHTYKGLGIELGYLDMFFLRTGKFYNPYTSLFGIKDEGLPTYGAGIAVPLHRFLTLSRSMTLAFDYARMGLRRDVGAFFTDDFNHESYAVRLAYGLSP